MMHVRHLAGLAGFAVLLATGSLAQQSNHSKLVSGPKGDGLTDDVASIQNALNAAAGSCGTVRLQCTSTNAFKISDTIKVPKCVRLVGECGAVPDEGSSTTVGTTLKWAGGHSVPVVAFHDAPGASLTGVSVDCQNIAGAIGIQYASDDNPPGSFVNIDTLMIKGCHQALVLGQQDDAAASGCPPGKPPIAPNCAEADQMKFERFRILGNLSDAKGEGIHINSANAAQGSLIINGNIQGVNRGIHVVSTNGGLVIQGTNIGSEVGADPAFIEIDPTVSDSPTLINDEVEAPPGVTVHAVVDHGCNPFGTPGTPVWLNNTWNEHPITLDGSETITSIGNLLNNAVLGVNAKCAFQGKPETPHVLSINESGWALGGAATAENLAIVADGGATFSASLIGKAVIEAEGPSCPSGKGREFPQGVNHGDLVACEGQHSGRLYLGQDLLLLNDGAGKLVIQAGVNPNGSGLKHQLINTGSIPASATTNVTLTWATAFADANYQAVCTVQDNTGTLQVVSTSVPEPSRVVAAIKNNGASPHAGSLACVAIHD